MARGWESKAIEQQQEEAASSKTARAPRSAEQIAEEQRREGIELSRQRILRQLQVACNPRHRQMLEKALEDLDAQSQNAHPIAKPATKVGNHEKRISKGKIGS